MVESLSLFKIRGCCISLDVPQWYVTKCILVESDCYKNVKVHLPPCTDLKVKYRICYLKSGKYTIFVSFNMIFTSSCAKDFIKFNIPILFKDNNGIWVELFKCSIIHNISKSKNIIRVCCSHELCNVDPSYIDNCDMLTIKIGEVCVENFKIYKYIIDDCSDIPDCDKGDECLFYISAYGNDPLNPRKVNIIDKILQCDCSYIDSIFCEPNCIEYYAKFEYKLLCKCKKITNVIYMNVYNDDNCNESLCQKIDTDCAEISIVCCTPKMIITPIELSCNSTWNITSKCTTDIQCIKYDIDIEKQVYDTKIVSGKICLEWPENCGNVICDYYIIQIIFNNIIIVDDKIKIGYTNISELFSKHNLNIVNYIDKILTIKIYSKNQIYNITTNSIENIPNGGQCCLIETSLKVPQINKSGFTKMYEKFGFSKELNPLCKATAHTLDTSYLTKNLVDIFNTDNNIINGNTVTLNIPNDINSLKFKYDVCYENCCPQPNSNNNLEIYNTITINDTQHKITNSLNCD